MLDERWSDDVVDVTSTLRALLADKCSEPVVRAAEQSDLGWSPDVDAHLRAFGLFDLPPAPELLTAVALELGRALAPVPWPEVAAARAVLDVDDAAYAIECDPPVGPPQALVRAGSGSRLVPNEGALERTGAGDVLVRVERGDGLPAWDEARTDEVRAMAQLLAAARVVGAAGRLVEIGVEYAKERHAFGRPIGSYQAISHKLATVATSVEGAELLLKKTAFLAGQADQPTAPSPLFGMMVWSNAVDAGRVVARVVHQCMGGFGAVLEGPAQLYSRRIRSWSLRLGRPQDHYREIGRMLLDPDRRDGVTSLWHAERGVHLPRWAHELDGRPNDG